MFVSNTSRTKILKPETQNIGSSMPRIDTVKDNYGNNFTVSSIEPVLNPRTEDGIYPGRIKVLKIFFIGKLLPTTQYLVINIPKNVFGNDKQFEITIPVKNNVTGIIRHPSSVVAVNSCDDNPRVRSIFPRR